MQCNTSDMKVNLTSIKILPQGRRYLRGLRSLVPDEVFLLSLGLNSFMGVLHSSSLPDYIEDKKSGGQQQSNLIPVSAGSDLRMSPLRPNPYKSIGIGERRSKFRGFLQLFSRPN